VNSVLSWISFTPFLTPRPVYYCPASYYAKHATVRVEEGTACTTFDQCEAFPELCGTECDSISDPGDDDANGGGDGDDDDGSGGDDLAWCDELDDWMKQFFSECLLREQGIVSSQVTDCSGRSMSSGDTRMAWLGDDYCDNNEPGSQANFNCEKFAYDCCDCAKDEDECREELEEEGNSYCQARRRLDTIRRLAQTKKTTACHPCKSKSYCPAGTVESEVAPCPRGFYCPNPSVKYECPVNHYCTNTQKVQCKFGMYCPLNATSGTECPAKYFCSEPQYKEVCPDGYYCRGGDIQPSRCSFFQTCPEGTKVPKGTARMMLLFLFAVFVTFEVIQWKWKQQAEKLALERKRKAAEEASTLVVGRQEFTALLQQNSFKIVHNASPEDLEKSGFTGFRVLQPDTTKLSFEFTDLSLALKSGTRIIDHVSGQVRSGKMTAIMGPSGCGKTTMLNVLRDKAGYGIIGGSLVVRDGKSEFDSIEPFKRIVGFVPQEDIMHSELTVVEAIMFSSLLKNKSSVSHSMRFKMVDEVIAVLGLEKCRNSVIGDQETRGVSGGQRKRVSIALEIVANPSICFLDEPTSGLDSTTSIELINTLKKMTDAGMTIVMVIHQPRYEIFNMIDDILFLGQNGRPVYMGASSQTLEYFNSIGFPCPTMKSPADHFLDVMSGTVVHSTKKDFTTADLSNWWEERQSGAANAKIERSGSTFNSSNPMRKPLGATGRTVPPPVPPQIQEAMKRKRSSINSQGESNDDDDGHRGYYSHTLHNIK
jgi:ABC-type multidrug transport system ATPase subunit